MIRYPKPPLLEQLPPTHGVVQASAGTGKTYLLERLVVDLLLRGRRLEEILVVTFTEKATLELRARVRGLLETLVRLEATPAGAIEPMWELTAERRELLAVALRSCDRAAIATIHGFCRQVLQESAFESGNLFRQQLSDGRTLFSQAFRDFLRTGPEAHAAAELIRQAMGSEGWTFTRLEDLLWNAHRERGLLRPELADIRDFEAQLRAFPVECLTQENHILEAMSRADLHPATRKAAASRLPGLLRLVATAPAPLAFLAAWDFDGVLKVCLAAPEGPARQLGEWLACARAQEVTTEAILVHGLLEPVRERLAELKAREGLFDFDDMVERVRAALHGRGQEDLVRKLRQRFKVALIDEFQDTDRAQWEIFRRIFLADGHQLYAIGDPKQAIYGFRGGDLTTYEQARQELGEGQAPLELDENFRSTQDIIAAYNHLLSHQEPAFFTAPNSYGTPVRCGRPQLALQDGAGLALKPVRVIQVPRQGGLWVYRAIAHTLAAEIKELIQGGACLGDLDALAEPAIAAKPGLRFSDVQVLTGKRSEGLLMAEALRDAGIPCAFFKQEGLFQSEEALDLLDVLRAVLHPGDRSRQARALLTPFFGYGLKDLEALPTVPEEHPALQRLAGWHRLGQERAFAALFDDLIHGSGLVARLRFSAQGDRALTNHLHLAEHLSAAARVRTQDTEDLVRLLQRWKDGEELPPGENGSVQRLEAEPDAVQILTMHQSKGLEAPVVALFGFTGPAAGQQVHRYHEGPDRCLWLGKPPETLKHQVEAETEQEAQRLLYVALTRAKARLLLPCFLPEPGVEKAWQPRGAYGALNPVLQAVVLNQERPGLFEAIPLRKSPEEIRAATTSMELSGWVLPEVPTAQRVDYEAPRHAARPLLTTSYTHLAHQLGERGDAGTAASLERSDGAEPPVSDPPNADLPGVQAAATDLPGGTRTGLAMHALLEEVDLDELRRAPAFEAWWTEGRKAWVRAILNHFDLGEDLAERAARRVFQAMHAPLPAAEGKPAPLLAHAPGRLLRELDFLSCFFETRDFLTGAMDVVFQREGLTYVLDWKNNLLGEYGVQALDDCVWGRYGLQVKLYTWVLLRWLRVDTAEAFAARFGGIHYVFLRGLPDAGVWFHRPTWAEVQVWKAELMDLHGEVTHA